MMREGYPISTGVTVEQVLDNNSFKIYYTDELDIDRIDIRSFNDSGISVLSDTKRIINSILSKNDDWYVFWNNN